MSATATGKVFEPDFGDDKIPKPTGKLFDQSGHTIRPKEGIVARLDAKGAEEITLRKGTLWAIGLVPVVAMLLFTYGSSLVGWTREDQEVRTKVEIMSKSMEDLNRKFDEIQKSLQEQALQKAKVEGYTLGQTDAGASGHKKEK